MPNVHLFAHKRPARPVRTKVFVDPSDRDFPIEVSFRAIDSLDGHAALDIEAEFIQRYVTGDEIVGEPPADFPFVGGEPVKLSKALCRNVANLVAMQSPVKEDGSPNAALWCFEDFVAMSVTHTEVWPAILAFAKEVEDARRSQKKSGLTGNGAKSSGSACATTDAIPNSTVA